MGTYGLAASIVVVILLVFCASLVWRQQRQLDILRRDIRRLERAHENLFVRLINLPSSRTAQEPSSRSPDASEEKNITAPKQPEEKNSKGSALYVVAPKTSPQ